MVERFAAMAQHAATTARDAPADGILAIVVSEESADYWPEMQWLATAVDDLGVPAVAVRPEEVVFTEAHLQAPYAGGLRSVSVVYRFFGAVRSTEYPQIRVDSVRCQEGARRDHAPVEVIS